MSAPPSPAVGGRVGGLRANSLAAVVMLLLQTSLGVGVNLYSTLPASDVGKSLPAGFTAAVGDGPLTLSLHALLGTLLLITASAALVRSALLRAPSLMGLTIVALLAIVVAWLSGSAFVGRPAIGTSLTMAIATAGAILCYVLVIFVLGLPARPRADASPQGG